jgi:hypothetical protein
MTLGNSCTTDLREKHLLEEEEEEEKEEEKEEKETLEIEGEWT